ncbi:unnamed protein product [Urochloa humidicola]
MAADLLPEDLLADVLVRLAPRWLATSRSVCKSWRAAIDGRRLLRADLLPLSLGGIFLEACNPWFPPLFSPPSAGVTSGILTGGDMDGFFDAVDAWRLSATLCDHCNGLLLLYDAVVNPATAQWARLPRPLPELYYRDMFLAFDPAVSPHYEVFSVPNKFPCDRPLPSPLALRVFSSETGQWEERTFVWEEAHAPTVAGIQSPEWHDPSYVADYFNYSAFCRGRLYVQFRNGFVMRINTSSGTCHLVKPPLMVARASKYRRYRIYHTSKYHQLYLGKSKDGVYYASVYPYKCRLQVWCLDESSYGQPKWVLRCDEDLRPLLPPRSYHQRDDGPWLLRYLDEEDAEAGCCYDEDEGQLAEWSSDIEDVPESGAGGCNGDDDGTKFYYPVNEPIDFLGFHPFKDVVFLHQSCRGIAYHLDCSRIQDMGNLDLHRSTERIEMPFPYTPCWMGVFPDNN